MNHLAARSETNRSSNNAAPASGVGEWIVQHAGEMTPAWLTALLRDGGHLGEGRVTAIDVALWHGKEHSNLYRLVATYAGCADDLPARLVCKISKPGAASSTARRRRWKEHEFYRRLVPAMPEAAVPRTYAAHYDAVSERALLLLEDLAESHARPPTPLPPTPGQLRGDVDCLADIHARWWDDEDLSGVKAERDARWIEQKAAASRRTLDRFVSEFGDHLPAAMRQALDLATEGWPAILRRAAQAPLTVVHGDAHPWNFLSPIAGEDGATRLLDWEGWSIEPGPHDLASLLALHLPPFMRREVEEALLQRYVGRLTAGGIAYDVAACRRDYRLAVARRMLAPVGMWSRGSQARSWWPILERVSAAFHELRCEDVLGED